MLSAPLGAGYGSLALLRPDFDWGAIALGAGLTTIGGLVPDLDSDSGVPVRELFGILAAAVAVAVFHPLREQNVPLEQALTIMAAVYFALRYGVANLFRRVSVHRGMYHSLPAMLITGLVVYLGYPSANVYLRLYLAGGIMVGFLSHLVLDELCSVDFMGFRIRLNKFAGSALKFASPSYPATITAYAILFTLGYFAWTGVPTWASHLPEGWKQFAWPQASHPAGESREIPFNVSGSQRISLPEPHSGFDGATSKK
jgi:hypothetical protein